MQLYSFFNSSTSYRVRIALALKGLSYEHKGINIRLGEQRDAAYGALNPSKGVPLLVTDDGMHLSQSLAIIQYLDDCYPEPALIPSDPRLKARVMEFCLAIACDIHPVNNLRVLGYLSNTLAITDEQRNAWYAHWISEGLSAAEQRLQGNASGPFCFGDAPTLADCCLIPQIANAQRMQCDLSPYPRLLEIYTHCQTLPAFQQAAPENQPDRL